MRHGKKLNSLSRKAPHRKAMLANMACSLIQHKRIETTVAKAKALRVYIEPLLTKSKTDSTHSRRTVFGYLQNKDAVTELFREVSPKIADRQGGYTRIIRLGNRLGDNAEMCMIELVDYNELMTKEPKEKKTRRSRRGGSSKSKSQASKPAEGKEETPKAEAKEETPKSEVKAEKKEEAPKAEKKAAPKAKKEEPKAEKKEAPKKAEAKKEEPKAKKEEPKAEKKEAKKSDDKKDDAPKAKKAAPKKEEKKEDKKDDKEEK